jgi:hypothetical protein
VELLCEYWAEELRSVQVMLYGYRQYGKSERYIEYHAKRRFSYFRKFLGKKKVDEIVDDVFKDLNLEEIRLAYEATLKEDEMSYEMESDSD